MSCEPLEAMTMLERFECLLSGNFALLLGDNFSQLASGLSEHRAARLLAEQWGITSRARCLVVIEDLMLQLGVLSAVEKRAIAEWLKEEGIDSDEYSALEKACEHLGLRAQVAHVDEMRREHPSVLAWDIQQLAELVRLALKVGHVGRDEAQEVMTFLSARARSGFEAWKDFSLCASVGMGMRGSMDLFGSSDWLRAVRTHSELLDETHLHGRCVPWGGVNESSDDSEPVPARAVMVNV
jgi:hypothetical protein